MASRESKHALPSCRRLESPPLCDGILRSIVKRRARLAGLEGDFGVHSLRSGFVTESVKQGVPLPAVMAMTEHRSVASVIGYFQVGAAEAGRDSTMNQNALSPAYTTRWDQLIARTLGNHLIDFQNTSPLH